MGKKTSEYHRERHLHKHARPLTRRVTSISASVIVCWHITQYLCPQKLDGITWECNKENMLPLHPHWWALRSRHPSSCNPFWSGLLSSTRTGWRRCRQCKNDLTAHSVVWVAETPESCCFSCLYLLACLLFGCSLMWSMVVCVFVSETDGAKRASCINAQHVYHSSTTCRFQSIGRKSGNCCSGLIFSTLHLCQCVWPQPVSLSAVLNSKQVVVDRWRRKRKPCSPPMFCFS